MPHLCPLPAKRNLAASEITASRQRDYGSYSSPEAGEDRRGLNTLLRILLDGKSRQSAQIGGENLECGNYFVAGCYICPLRLPVFEELFVSLQSTKGYGQIERDKTDEIKDTIVVMFMVFITTIWQE